MNYQVTDLCISEASRGLIIEATVSIPTRRQFTNESHGFCNMNFREVKSTKSTLRALWRFWKGMRKRVKEIQSIEGNFDLSTTNFAKGVSVN